MSSQDEQNRINANGVNKKEEVLKPVFLKREGSYWDFKSEWYSHGGKPDLLHDLIYMANNLENRDAYIIIGIDDENDFKLMNVKGESNRKNTQMMVDFLKDKKFAGGVGPMVYIETVFLLQIRWRRGNNFSSPFYGMHAGF